MKLLTPKTSNLVISACGLHLFTPSHTHTYTHTERHIHTHTHTQIHTHTHIDERHISPKYEFVQLLSL